MPTFAFLLSSYFETDAACKAVGVGCLGTYQGRRTEFPEGLPAEFLVPLPQSLPLDPRMEPWPLLGRYTQEIWPSMALSIRRQRDGQVPSKEAIHFQIHGSMTDRDGRDDGTPVISTQANALCSDGQELLDMSEGWPPRSRHKRKESIIINTAAS